MAETIHTFTGGMDLDSDKALRSSNTTHEVYDFRIVNNEDGTSGALVNVRGNTTYRIFNPDVFTDMSGYCVIRNNIIVFGTRESDSANIIFHIVLDENDNRVSDKVIYDDSLNNNGGTLDFPVYPNYTLRAVGRYESENIIKVYWTDGSNPVRFMNIAINNTTDGEEYSTGVNYYVSVDKLEFKPDFLVSNIESIEVKKGGNLETGIVQYCIQLYNKYGAETFFSPLTNPLHIVESSDNTFSSTSYKGSEVDTITGKSVEITINHPSANEGYDYLKVVRVQYTTYNSIPTVNVVADIEINKYFSGSSETYKVIDTGNSIYELTPEEIAITGSTLFSAKDIIIKDNLLICGNIKENFFDVDFDARSFRFASGGMSSYLTNGGTNSLYTLSADTIVGWNAWDVNVPETHDAINLYNDLTYDDKSTYLHSMYNCKYQLNGSTIGGSGRNVKYEFVTNDFVLDSISNITKSGSNSTVRTIMANPGSGDNYSFSNYASPYMSQVYRGYQRGEVYRFGIVFFDKKGRSSKVKWIGDIRFPSFKDTITGYSNRLSDLVTGTIESDYIGIKFYVRNVPTDAVAWQIVRMERTSIDKTIMSQGIISSSIKDTAGTNGYAPYFPIAKASGTSYGGYTVNGLNDDILIYMSPDINYGELDYKSGDYFETIGYFDNYGTYTTDAADVAENVIKYNDTIISTSYSIITPTLLKYINVTGTNDTISIGGLDFHNIVTRDPGERNGLLGNCAVFTYTGTFIPTGSSTLHSPTIVNLRRINNGQYGGNTYENRFGNQYISCGTIVNNTSASFTTTNTYATGIDIYGGDIFITIYERLHAIYADGIAEACRVCYIPLESKYNLNISHGDTYSRLVSIDTDVYLIKENAGTHSDGSAILEQENNFYIYNTVYSNNISPIVYFSSSNIDNDIEDYDTRIIVSNTKINNEIVDSWTKFSVNDYIDTDSTYGPINTLCNYRGKIFFHQDTAFGILSINERALITSTDSASGLVLGSGGILDRYDYLSTYWGNVFFHGVVSNESGIYWIDNFKGDVVLYDGSTIKPLSKLKKVDTYFKTRLGQLYSVTSTYFSKYNEVWFSIMDAVTYTPKILVFSELYNCFSSFYDNPASLFIPTRSKLLSYYVYTDIHKGLWEEDAGDYCSWFNLVYTCELNILHSENYPSIKTYDNIEYVSKVTDENGLDLFEETFKYLQVYNDYQNTGRKTILKDLVTTVVGAIPVRRRERKWTIAIPRNIVNKDVTDNEDIFYILNLDETQLYKERIRNDWGMFKFEYTNYDNYKISIPYIKIIYRISQR